MVDTVQSYNQATWASQVLADAGLPQSTNNIQNIVRWMVAEEPPSNWWDRNNPLNASLGTTSTSGLGTYPDLSTGAKYTAAMINQSNMAGIRNALANNADPNTFSAAVVASPWASSHYGGNPLHIAQIPLPSFIQAGSSATIGSGTNAGASSAASGSSAGGYNGISVPVLGTIISGQQEMVIKGWFFIIAGGLVGAVGAAVVLAALGLETKIGRAAVEAVPGGVAVKAAAGRGTSTQRSRRQASERAAAQRQEDRLQVEEMRGRERRYEQRARSEPGARRATPEQRTAARDRLERSRRSLTPAERRQVETF